MAFGDFFWNYGRYIELLAYILAIISVFLPFLQGTLDNWHSVQIRGTLYRDTISISYIRYKPGICIFIFTIISIILVLLALFARGLNRKLRNKFVGKTNIIDAIIELLPLHFTLNSLILSFISASDVDGIRPAGNVSIGAGYYLLLIALIIAAIVRIIYLFMKYSGSSSEPLKSRFMKYGGSEPEKSEIVIEDSYAMEV